MHSVEGSEGWSVLSFILGYFNLQILTLGEAFRISRRFQSTFLLIDPSKIRVSLKIIDNFKNPPLGDVISGTLEIFHQSHSICVVEGSLPKFFSRDLIPVLGSPVA